MNMGVAEDRVTALVEGFRKDDYALIQQALSVTHGASAAS
jgi:hypothetical protein